MIRICRQSSSREARLSSAAASSASTSSARPCSSAKSISIVEPRTRASNPVSRRNASRARPASAGSTRSRLARAASASRRPSGRPARRRARTALAGRSGARAGGGPPGPAPRARPARGPRVSSPRSTIAEHVVGQLEQPQPVRDRRLRAPDPLGDVAERERELVDERRVGARLLDRRQLLAGDVLDQREEERVPVVGLPHDRRHRRHARLARGAPAPLAGDQLPAAARHAAGRARAGRRPARGSTRRGRTWPRRRSGAAAGAGWGGSRRRAARPDRPASRRRAAPRGRGRGRGARAGVGSGALDKLHRHLPVRLGARSTRGRRRSPAARGSAPRRAAPSAGTVVSKTRSPRCRRTSSSTCAASRVRRSTIVRSTPASASRGLSRCRTSSTERRSCVSPSSA